MSPSSRNHERPGYAAYKVVVSLLLLALAAMAAIVFLVGAHIFTATEVFGDWRLGHQALAFLDELGQLGRVLAVALTVVLGLVCLVILQRMWLPPGRSRAVSLHILDADDLGRVWVDSASVAVVARQAALSVRGVIDAQVRVNGSVMAPVEVNVDVDYYPGARLKDSGVQVRVAVRDAVQDLVGLEVRQVEVREKVLEPEELTRMLA